LRRFTFVPAVAILVLAAAGQNAVAKDFSGRIVYGQRYADPKTGSALKELGGQPLDLQQIYEIDGRNYRAFNEHGRLVQLYRNDENAYYAVWKGEVTKRDASQEEPRVLAIRNASETAIVLGRKCRRVDIETNRGVDTYYFDPAGPRVSAKAFHRHAFGGWDRYLEAAGGALPLKMIIRNSVFVATIEATSIADLKFGPDDFRLESAMRGRTPAK
jgi:hypothetical protein